MAVFSIALIIIGYVVMLECEGNEFAALGYAIGGLMCVAGCFVMLAWALMEYVL